MRKTPGPLQGFFYDLAIGSRIVNNNYSIGLHALGLARQLLKEIDAQGKRLFTPMDNESPVVTCYLEDPAAASIDVTVREKEKQVRVSPALFNTSDEVGKFLEVLKKVK